MSDHRICYSTLPDGRKFSYDYEFHSIVVEFAPWGIDKRGNIRSINKNKNKLLFHRIVAGKLKIRRVAFIDGNYLNCCKSNLTEYMKTIKGIYQIRNGQYQVQHGGIYIGIFNSLDEAAVKYKEWLKINGP